MDESADARPGGHSAPDLDPTKREVIERSQTQIGPYRLLELVGEGAMGEVWRAEQRDPIHRILALKIIKRGMDTREMVTRFEIERQAMALMEHPGIAKVFDAGVTADGRPYIAMEYVAGERLTDFCARNRLSIEERLRLFQKVCQAIQHAHQKAVIHRDLKPSNILVVEVDGEPVPKVIDFGIAKATAQRLTDRSAATFLGQLIGTPLYMSPEQVEMSAAGVDTRADVYSLGVVLYELLSGTLPHDPEKLAHAAFDEVLEVLRDEEPKRPSTRVSTLGERTEQIAEQRRLDAKKLVGKLQGDLDWITLKALEKDRKRRYDTPQDLADDIEHYLRHEVVRARPPSASYRVSRFVRRHRAPVMLATSLLVALVCIAIWQNLLLDVISSERDRAMASERLSIAREWLTKDPTTSVAFALSSIEIADSEEARNVIRRALLEGPVRDELPRADLWGHPLSVDASMDGRLLAVTWQVESLEPAIAVHDLQSGIHRLFLASGTGSTYQVRFTADGAHVVALGLDGLHLWRVSDGRHLLHAFQQEQWLESMMVFALDDPDRIFVTTCEEDGVSRWYELGVKGGTIRQLGASVGRRNRAVELHLPGIDGPGDWVLEFDGTQLFRQRVEDLGSTRAELIGRHPVDITSVAMDRAGQTAASLDMNRDLWIWDLSEPLPRVTRRLRVHTGTHFGTLIFDPHRPRLAFVGRTPHAEIFDLDPSPPRQPTTLQDRTGWTHEMTFLPDGSLITSRNSMPVGPIAHWRRPTPWEWSVDLGELVGAVRSPIVSADGSSIFAWMGDGKVVRIPVTGSGGGAIEVLGTTNVSIPGMPRGLMVSEDERLLATFRYGDRGLWRIDRTTGVTEHIRLFEREYTAIGLSPSGRRAAFWDYPNGDGDDWAIVVVDLDARTPIAMLNTERVEGANLRFVDDENVELSLQDCVVGVRLERSDVVDTLWHEPGTPVRLLGRSPWIMTGSASDGFSIVDHRTGRVRAARIQIRSERFNAAFLEGLGILVIANFPNDIAIHEIDTGRSWTLPIGRSSAEIAIDPLGRWFVLNVGDSPLRALRLPPDPMFGDLPTHEFLELARRVTNVRVVPDPSWLPEWPGDIAGFRITNTLEESR